MTSECGIVCVGIATNVIHFDCTIYIGREEEEEREEEDAYMVSSVRKVIMVRLNILKNNMIPRLSPTLLLLFH